MQATVACLSVETANFEFSVLTGASLSLFTAAGEVAVFDGAATIDVLQGVLEFEVIK